MPRQVYRDQYLLLILLWVVILAAMTAVSLLLALTVTGRLLEPIRTVIQVAERMAEGGEFSVRCDIQTGDEIKRSAGWLRAPISRSRRSGRWRRGTSPCRLCLPEVVEQRYIL